MRVARAVADGVVAVALFPWIFARAMLVRREPKPERPRVLWGVTPLISLKYWSESVRRRGFDSKTVVIGVYSINRRSDFDVVFERGGLRGLVWPYLAFARYLSRDVHVLFFDGGFLANTALARLEGPLLRLARRRLVLVPYGSDIAVPGMLGPLESPLREEYSILFERAEPRAAASIASLAAPTSSCETFSRAICPGGMFSGRRSSRSTQTSGLPLNRRMARRWWSSTCRTIEASRERTLSSPRSSRFAPKARRSAWSS